jgi:hypothetical protein
MDDDAEFELLVEDLGAELESFRMNPTPEAEEDARRAFELVIAYVRPSPPLRLESVGGVLVAYLGQEEVGPVDIVGGGIN